MRRIQAVALIGVLALAACETPEAPEGVGGATVRASDVTAAGGEAFYYYEGQKVALEPDYTHITVAYDHSHSSQGVRDAAAQVLVPFGLQIGYARALPQVAHHETFTITGRPQAGDSVLASLRRRAEIAFAAPAYVVPSTGDTLTLVDQLVVHFKAGVGLGAIDKLVSASGMSVVRPPRPDSGFAEYRLAYPRGADPLQVAAEFENNPLVTWAEPNKIGSKNPLLSTPSDPYYSLQYYYHNLDNPGVDDSIEPAWDITLGGGIPSGGGVRVAIIDDGVEAAHPDFGSQVNGGGAYDAVIGDDAAAANPTGINTHGTNVAGLIVAQQDNGEGTAGGAPAVWVTPIRIFYVNSGGTDILASDADVADAINYAWYYCDADVVSDSWYWPHTSTAITDAINNAVAQGRDGRGAVVVFAAGNTSNREGGHYGSVTYPASLGSTIAVGAIDRTGEAANYTPRGSLVDIVAPSGYYAHRHGLPCDTRGDVVTTELTDYNGCNDGPNGDVDYTSHFTGTSAAAPQVAAAAALVISEDPTISGASVRSRLLDNADTWGRSDDFGHGKLNVYDAVHQPMTVTVDAPALDTAYHSVAATAMVSHGVSPFTYAWTINGSPACGNQNTCTGQVGAQGTITTFAVTVTDSSSPPQQASGQAQVYAQWSDCLHCLKPTVGGGPRGHR